VSSAANYSKISQIEQTTSTTAWIRQSHPDLMKFQSLINKSFKMPSSLQRFTTIMMTISTTAVAEAASMEIH
jgi:hypothetical protein